MSCRVLTTRKLPTRIVTTRPNYPPSAHFLPRFPPRFRPKVRYISSSNPSAHHCEHYTAAILAKQSGTGFWAAAVVFGFAIGGALLFPLLKGSSPSKTKPETPSSNFDSLNFTDSYLIMAPNTPAGRPGTLTPEQETKLRELWAATLKVFGVFESAAEEVNGVETPASTTTATETSEKDGKKDKKKSRLNVFKRNKTEKQTESGASTPAGAVTPSDISSMSIADEDDKYGQTKDFKAALANSTPEDLRTAFWSMVKCDHPDALLLRFLRARKWDVEKALVMMISTMHWRLVEQHVDDDIMTKGELAALEDSKSDDPKVKKEGEDFLTQMRIGKSYLHGLDSEGRPLCVVRVRLHRAGEQSEESMERFTVYTIETARLLLRPPVDTATIVFDMTNFSMANMDYAPVKFMIKCFEANYPESLGTVLVYKAPWVFNAIWSIIRGWLDPVVAGKVHFVKNVEELSSYIPKKQIPTELGGDEEWEYSYTEPQPGENEMMKDEAAKGPILAERDELVKKYENTILDWVAEGEKAKTIEERRKERDTLAENIRLNYWKLDPYVRARSVYDRIGMLQDGGKLDYYPEAKKDAKKEEAAPAAAAAVETGQDDLD